MTMGDPGSARAQTAYTGEAVALHTEPIDLWVIINEEVYSLIGFLEENPGGAQDKPILLRSQTRNVWSKSL